MECDWFLATLRNAAVETVVCTDTDDDDDELSEGDANSTGGGMMAWSDGGEPVVAEDFAKPLSPLDECDGLPCGDGAPTPTDELVDRVDSDDSRLAVSSVTTLSRLSCDEHSPAGGCSVDDSPTSGKRK